MKMLIDIWLDGYENEEELRKACKEFVEELNQTSSYIKILWIEGEDNENPSPAS